MLEQLTKFFSKEPKAVQSEGEEASEEYAAALRAGDPKRLTAAGRKLGLSRDVIERDAADFDCATVGVKKLADLNAAAEQAKVNRDEARRRYDEAHLAMCEAQVASAQACLEARRAEARVQRLQDDVERAYQNPRLISLPARERATSEAREIVTSATCRRDVYAMNDRAVGHMAKALSVPPSVAQQFVPSLPREFVESLPEFDPAIVKRARERMRPCLDLVRRAPIGADAGDALRAAEKIHAELRVELIGQKYDERAADALLAPIVAEVHEAIKQHAQQIANANPDRPTDGPWRTVSVGIGG